MINSRDILNKLSAEGNLLSVIAATPFIAATAVKKAPKAEEKIAEETPAEGLTTESLKALTKAITLLDSRMQALNTASGLSKSDPVYIQRKAGHARDILAAVRTFTGLTYNPPSPTQEPTAVAQNDAFVEAYLDLCVAKAVHFDLYFPDQKTTPLRKELDDNMAAVKSKISDEQLSLVACAMGSDMKISGDKKIVSEKMVYLQITGMSKAFSDFYHDIRETQDATQLKFLVMQLGLKMLNFRAAVMLLKSMQSGNATLAASIRHAMAGQFVAIEQEVAANNGILTNSLLVELSKAGANFKAGMQKLVSITGLDQDTQSFEREVSQFKEYVKPSVARKIGRYLSTSLE